MIWRTRDPEEPLSARPQARTDRTPQANINEISGRPNMDNAIKTNNQLQGCRKIRGTKQGVENEQSQERKSKMCDTEDTLNVTKTKTQTKIILALTTISLTHSQAEEYEEREEPKGTMQKSTPQTQQAHLTKTTR